MIINIFDKEVQLRDTYCTFFNDDPIAIEKPYINLYVRFKGCNADCSFCEYKETANKFNFKKYQEILTYLHNKVEIRKIAFTGGEPTLFYDKFKDVINFTDDTIKTFIQLNTNGVNLTKLVNDIDLRNKITNIAISRHHYIEENNNKILGFKSVSNKELEELQKSIDNKDLLHLACNLIKDEIDTKEKIYNYLEYMNHLDIYSVGFISLMPVNSFCKDNFIDFNTLHILKDKKIFLTKRHTYKDACVCTNYRYIPDSIKEKTIKIYFKNSYGKQEVVNSLIFDGEFLRYGFSEEIIY